MFFIDLSYETYQKGFHNDLQLHILIAVFQHLHGSQFKSRRYYSECFNNNFNNDDILKPICMGAMTMGFINIQNYRTYTSVNPHNINVSKTNIFHRKRYHTKICIYL